MIGGYFKKRNIEFNEFGGHVKTKTYFIDSAMIAAGNAQSMLYSVPIWTDTFRNGQKYTYGNLGEDYMNNFSEMKINFNGMNVSFSGKKHSF